MSDPTKTRRPLSRREFFKMAGIGTGAAVALSALQPEPVQAAAGAFKDPAGRMQRPWWVRTVDQPTTEVDWSKMERFHKR
jgi:hypothetical protein